MIVEPHEGAMQEAGAMDICLRRCGFIRDRNRHSPVDSSCVFRFFLTKPYNSIFKVDLLTISIKI